MLRRNIIFLFRRFLSDAHDFCGKYFHKLYFSESFQVDIAIYWHRKYLWKDILLSSEKQAEDLVNVIVMLKARWLSKRHAYGRFYHLRNICFLKWFLTNRNTPNIMFSTECFRIGVDCGLRFCSFDGTVYKLYRACLLWIDVNVTLHIYFYPFWFFKSEI